MIAKKDAFQSLCRILLGLKPWNFIPKKTQICCGAIQDSTLMWKSLSHNLTCIITVKKYDKLVRLEWAKLGRRVRWTWRRGLSMQF